VKRVLPGGVKRKGGDEGPEHTKLAHSASESASSSHQEKAAHQEEVDEEQQGNDDEPQIQKTEEGMGKDSAQTVAREQPTRQQKTVALQQQLHEAIQARQFSSNLAAFTFFARGGSEMQEGEFACISRTAFKSALTEIGLVLQDNERKALRKSLGDNSETQIMYAEFERLLLRTQEGRAVKKGAEMVQAVEGVPQKITATCTNSDENDNLYEFDFIHNSCSRSIGEVVTRSDMAAAIEGVSRIQVNEIALVRRSDKQWRYARLSEKDADGVCFVVNSAMQVKYISKDWYSEVRRLLPLSAKIEDEDGDFEHERLACTENVEATKTSNAPQEKAGTKQHAAKENQKRFHKCSAMPELDSKQAEEEEEEEEEQEEEEEATAAAAAKQAEEEAAALAAAAKQAEEQVAAAAAAKQAHEEAAVSAAAKQAEEEAAVAAPNDKEKKFDERMLLIQKRIVENFKKKCCGVSHCKNQDIDPKCGLCNGHSNDVKENKAAGYTTGCVLPEVHQLMLIPYSHFKKDRQIRKYEEYMELEKKERCKILIQYSELVRTKKRQNSFVMMMSHQWDVSGKITNVNITGGEYKGMQGKLIIWPGTNDAVRDNPRKSFKVLVLKKGWRVEIKFVRTAEEVAVATGDCIPTEEWKTWANPKGVQLLSLHKGDEITVARKDTGFEDWPSAWEGVNQDGEKGLFDSAAVEVKEGYIRKKGMGTVTRVYSDMTFDVAFDDGFEEQHVNAMRIVDGVDAGGDAVGILGEHLEQHAKTDHPDRIGEAGNPKHKLVVSGINKLLAGSLKGKEVYLWIDYSCMPQDGSVDEIASLPSYLERMDGIFTPIVDPDPFWVNMDNSAIKSSWFEDYNSRIWVSYTSRAWCRMEFFMNANAPLHPDCCSYYELVGSHLQGRVHFLYGTREAERYAPPIVLAPLLNTLYEDFRPEEGEVSQPPDIKNKIKPLCEAMARYVKEVAKSGYEGGTDAEGMRHGQGVNVYESGARYEGQWQRGEKHGEGKYQYPSGDRYEGQFKNGVMYGQGEFHWTVGDRYDGQWENGVQHGQGRMHWADGGWREGTWRNDKNHGSCTYHYASGKSEVEEFVDGIEQ
jgi:hypothetical protein